MAAVLALDGILSHRSAAALWRLLPPKARAVDVSVVGDGGRSRREGIRVHRTRTLTDREVTSRLGIPVTTAARTIIDLRKAAGKDGSIASARELRQAVRQAGVLGLQIDIREEPDRTRSELEHLFLQLCRRHALPMPEVNVRIDSLLVDFLWRDRRLIAETDGYRYHGGRAAFEDDRDRDLKLRSLGYEVLRLSYRQVVDQPAQVAEVLSAELRLA